MFQQSALIRAVKAGGSGSREKICASQSANQLIKALAVRRDIGVSNVQETFLVGFLVAHGSYLLSDR